MFFASRPRRSVDGPFLRFAALVLCACLAVLATSAVSGQAAANPTTANAATVLLEELSPHAAKALRVHGTSATLRVVGVALDLDSALVLRPLDVFAPDADITIQTDIHSDIHSDVRSFKCANRDLPATPDLGSLLESEYKQGRLDRKHIGPSYTARIAFETDQEYLDLFGGDTDAAVDYIGDLVALGSMIYSDEVSTSWLVAGINLWTTPDPWDQSSSRCSLFQFGKYWNDHNADVERTIAHMLSGRNSFAGIAWLGALCRGGFAVDTDGAGCSFSNTSNYGGGYGYTRGIRANFDLESPAPLWDSVAVLHEIGHNFNSPHTGTSIPCLYAAAMYNS